MKLKILFTLTLPSPIGRGKYFVGDGVLAQHAEVTRCERPVVVKMTVGDGVLDVPLG